MKMSDKEKSCFQCKHKNICKHVRDVTQIKKIVDLKFDTFFCERIFAELPKFCAYWERNNER